MLLCASPIAGAQAAEATWGVEHVLSSVAAQALPSVRYREKKYLDFLKIPLFSEGFMYYRAPSYLKKEVLTPEQESFVIQGNELSISGPDRETRNLHLGDYPLLQGFVESLRATLGGDLGTLQQYYRVELQGNQRAWQLRLTPTERALAQYISRITIHGEASRIRSVHTLETDGDHSRTDLIYQGE